MHFKPWRKLKFRKPTLLQTLVTAFVLPLLLTGTLIEYLTWRQEQKAVENLVWQLQDAVGDRIVERISRLTASPEMATFRVARALRRGDLDPDDVSTWKAYMADQGQFFNDLTFIFYGNTAGDFVTLYQRSEYPDQISFRDGSQPEKVTRHELLPGEDKIFEQTTQPFFPPNRPWYQTAVAAEGPVWTEPYEFFVTSGGQSRQERMIRATGITFVVPYYAEFSTQTDTETDFVLDNTSEKTLLGVIGVDFTLEDINRFLGRLDVSESGEAFIMNRKGQLIASSHPTDFSQEKTLPLTLEATNSPLIEQTGNFLQLQFQNFDNIAESESLSFRVNGKRQLLQIRPYTNPYGLDWLIVVVVPEADFLGPIRGDARTRGWISLAALILVVFLLLAIARRINRSMRGLSQASQSIAAGNRYRTVPKSFIQEIDVTASAFNQMGQKLTASYDQLEKYSKSLEEKVKERTQSLEQEVRDRTRSETTFRNLVSNIPGTVYRCSYSTEWVMEFMSDSVEEISGYPASDFVQNRVRSYLSIIFSDDIATILPTAEAAIYRGDPYCLEYRIKHADGGLRWICDKGKGVFDEKGDLLYLDGAFFDVTSVKQAEDALQHQREIDSLISRVSRSLLENDLETAVDFALEQIGRFTKSDRVRIFQFDQQKQFQLTHNWANDNSPDYVETRRYVNDRNYAWFYHQLISGEILQFSSLDDLPPEAETSKAVLRSQNVQSLLDVPMVYGSQTVGLMTLDTVHQQRVWTESEINLVRLVAEMIAMAKQKHTVELGLVQAKEEAEIASRAKGDFLASMSHELRSPLNAILGFAQIMQKSPHLPERHHDDVQIINRSGEHLLALINNVLDMSKIEAGHITLNPIDFDLQGLLQDVHSLFARNAEAKHIRLKQTYPKNLPRYIKADEGKLRQVLLNLLNNSLKFTQEGSITLSAYLQNARCEKADDTAESTMLLHFSVTDTGPGIDVADEKTVFEPFVQSQSGRDSQEGTGLGLSICRKFVQLMGGEISLKNRTDGTTGTVAAFTIQAQKSTVQSAEQIAPTRKIVGIAAGQSRYKILAVDDKAANLQLLVRLLEPLELEVRTASNGKAAVETAVSWHPDLIWMDLRMPVMDGIEATRQIRERMSTHSQSASLPKIVALSATSFVSNRADAIAAGCNAFIAKPFQPAEIFDCMAEQLGLRYRYADEQNGTNPKTRRRTIDPKAMAELSPQIRSDLEQAILRLRWNEILRLIEQISAQDSALAEALSQTVHDFQYGRILEAIGR